MLLAQSVTRPKPHRDDKIITAWNGLAIAALAKQSSVFGEEKYTAAAKDAASFIQNNLWDTETKTLYRSYRRKCGDAEAFPADYAFLIFGFIELHAVNPAGNWLEWVTELQTALDTDAWDAEIMGY